MQVTPVGKLGQSGVLQSQSVASYRAVDFPIAPLNGKDVCANCEDATSRRSLGLRSSGPFMLSLRAQSRLPPIAGGQMTRQMLRVQHARHH